MRTFLISYDLKQPNRNYEGLYNSIKGLGGWWHYLESTWLVKTSFDLDHVQKVLNSQIDSNDSLLIIEVRRPAGGWLPQKAWSWIKENTSL